MTAACAASILTLAGATAAAAYEVRPGDTLSQIAAERGVPGGWPALFELNRSVVGDDPDLIFPGQVLRLDRAGPRKAEPEPAADSSTSDGTARPGTGHVTSRYGMRTHPITGVHKLHTGTDFSYGDGVARAARAGTVAEAGWAGGYGRMVTVGHAGDVVTRYAHLAGFRVTVGERVAAGEPVGAIGSSGYSTGPHLHFEVLIDGDFADPERWLR